MMSKVSKRTKLKVGDLIRVPDCPPREMGTCQCFFCIQNSKRIGVVYNISYIGTTKTWEANFDIGKWTFNEHNLDEVEVINESR